MKLLKVSLCAVAASMAMAGAAAAQEITFNAGATTAYVFRGLKQTTGDCCNETAPGIFGGADVTFADDFYAGIWVSNTGASTLRGLETDLYVGWKPSLGPVDLDLGVIFYSYNKSAGGSAANVTEWKAGASLPVGDGSVGLAVYYTDDVGVFAPKTSQTYTELTASWPVGDRFTVSGGIAQGNSTSYGGNHRYTTFNLGVTVPISPKVSLDARYIGTDSSAKAHFGAQAFGDGLVATIKANF